MRFAILLVAALLVSALPAHAADQGNIDHGSLFYQAPRRSDGTRPLTPYETMVKRVNASYHQVPRAGLAEYQRSLQSRVAAAARARAR